VLQRLLWPAASLVAASSVLYLASKIARRVPNAVVGAHFEFLYFASIINGILNGMVQLPGGGAAAPCCAVNMFLLASWGIVVLLVLQSDLARAAAHSRALSLGQTAAIRRESPS
jgi:hypothetical protein